MVVEMPEFTADRVRALRRKLKLTQTEFGKLVGASQQLVAGWETDVIRPGRYTHVAALLQLEEEALLNA